MKLNSKGEMKKHLIVIFILFLFAFIGLIIRVTYINIREKQTYQTSVLSQHVNNLTISSSIPAKRGDILDRNGTILAESIKVYNVIYDPSVLNKNKEEVIQKTNQLLSQTIQGITIAELERLLKDRKNSSYQVIAKALEYEAVKALDQAIKESTIKGVFLEGYYKRIYPYQTMASDILGFYNVNTGGNYGVEGYYDVSLSGKDGRLFGAIDKSFVNQEEVPAEDGENILTTIDFGVQKYVEQAIENYYKEHDAKSVNVIVLNPKNGEILAMASSPSFNSNMPFELKGIIEEKDLALLNEEDKNNIRFGLWKSYLISDSYEPGSTFKPFVLAAGIEEGKINLNSSYNCDGGKEIHGHYIRCWKAGGHGMQTASQALANSCNVAFMEIGEKIGKKIFYDYEMKFGFGSKTNVDMLGEGKGVLNTYEQIGPVELATGSFGQGFNVTPIQLISAFSSLINGGKLYEPYIVKEVQDINNNTFESHEPRLIRQTISEETSKEMLKALEMVVEDGTGNKASVEGYRIGGKTGTAEKGNREDDLYIVSFIGFVPAENPQMIALVIVDEPNIDNPDSGLASNIFKDFMGKVLPYKSIF